MQPGAELERLAGTAPGPRTLFALAAMDMSALSAHDRVRWLELWQAHRGWFDAHAQAGIVAVGGAATGRGRLDTARELASRLTRTLAALESGQLTYWHAKAMSDAVASLKDSAALAVRYRRTPGQHCRCPRERS